MLQIFLQCFSRKKCEICSLLMCEAVSSEREQLADKSHGDGSARTSITETFVSSYI